MYGFLVESISHLLWPMHLDNSENKHSISLPNLTTHYDKAAYLLTQVPLLAAYHTSPPVSLMQDHEQVAAPQSKSEVLVVEPLRDLGIPRE